MKIKNFVKKALMPMLWGVGLVVFSGLSGAYAVAPVLQNCAAVSQKTCNIAHALGRGINFGNMFEAPREGDWGIRLEPRFIDLVDGQFSTVRLPVRWSNHADKDAQAKIDDFFAERIEGVVDELLARDMYVIINMHHYNQLVGKKPHNGEFTVAPEVLEARFLNMWKQIALRFKDKSDKLVFELLNEPNGSLSSEQWNQLAQKALNIVRVTNPNRTVLMGPTYHNSFKDLPKLNVPNDKNIIIAIHNYSPFFFTHQGVTYLPMNMPKGVTCCNAKQKNEILGELDAAIAWNKQFGYPIHLGEFGTYSHADMDSRVNYARFVRDSLEARGIGWTYWEFGSSFGIYNPKKNEWIVPLKNALLGD